MGTQADCIQTRVNTWASDRIGTYGVIGFVTPNSINDKGSMAGFRKVINEGFNHIYTYNLTGAIKGKIGDDALKEGGSVFDIMIGTAITILVKDNTDENTVNYFEVAPYQSKEEKLESIKTLQSINNLKFKKITLDKNNDWINQRDDSFDAFYKLDNEIFNDRATVLSTSRDSWVYGFNSKKVINNTNFMIKNYNDEVKK